MSQAIADGDLLSLFGGSGSINNGQIVTIKDDLIVDTDYVFGYNNGSFSTINQNSMVNRIFVEDGVKIIVEDNNDFVLDWGELVPCNTEWDGIDLMNNSTFIANQFEIEGAKIAIEAVENSRIDLIANNIFRNNDLSIGAFSTGGMLVDLNIFGTINDANYFFDGTEAIHLENVFAPTSGTINVFGQFVINGMEKNGIYLENTSMNLGNGFAITNCGDAGIRIDEHSNELWTRWGGINNCNRYGIYTAGNNIFDIESGDFYSNGISIRRETTLEGEDTEIWDSRFRRAFTDIRGSLRTSTGRVYNNEFSLNSTNDISNYNVFLDGGNNAVHNWEIFDNDFNALWTNIFLRSITATTLQNNNEMTAGFYNFYTTGGRSNDYLQNSGTSNLTSFQMHHHQQSEIECNIFQAPDAMVFFQDNGGARIEGNRLKGLTGSGQINLTYGSPNNTFALTSQQNLAGNIFDLSNNANKRAVNYEPNPVMALNSQYLVGESSNNQGSQWYPFFDATANNWFFPIGNPSLNFDECGEEGSEVPPSDQERLKAAVNSGIYLLDNGLKEQYGEELDFNIKLTVLENLRKLTQTAILDSVQQNSLNSIETTVVADYMDVLETIEAATNFTATEAAQLVSLRENIRNLRNQIFATNWYTYDSLSNKVIIDEDKKSIVNNLSIEKSKLMNDLNSLLTSKQQTGFSGESSSVIPNTPKLQPAKNLTTMLPIYIDYLKNNSTDYDSEEVAVITEVANQCVGKGGKGVYIARYLIAQLSDTLIVYNDECIIPINEQQPLIAETNGNNAVTVFPNPANDYLSIEIPVDISVNRLQIINATGAIQYDLQVSDNNHPNKIDISTFPQGTYWLAIHNDIEPIIKPFIVQR